MEIDGVPAVGGRPEPAPGAGGSDSGQSFEEIFGQEMIGPMIQAGMVAMMPVIQRPLSEAISDLNNEE